MRGGWTEDKEEYVSYCRGDGNPPIRRPTLEISVLEACPEDITLFPSASRRDS